MSAHAETYLFREDLRKFSSIFFSSISIAVWCWRMFGTGDSIKSHVMKGIGLA